MRNARNYSKGANVCCANWIALSVEGVQCIYIQVCKTLLVKMDHCYKVLQASEPWKVRVLRRGYVVTTNPNHPPAEIPVPGASPTQLYPSIQDNASENGPLLQSTAGEWTMKSSCLEERFFSNHKIQIFHHQESLYRVGRGYPNTFIPKCTRQHQWNEPLLQSTAGEWTMKNSCLEEGLCSNLKI